MVADGGRGGVGADQTGNNNDDDPFRNHGGGGGGGRIGILKFGANTFTGTLSAAGGGSFVHDAGKYGYKLWQACSDEFRATNVGDSMVSGLLIPTPACALSRRMPAFATGGGGAGTVFVYNAADAAGELMINNDGMTPDHPTRVTNTPGAYNMTLGRLQLRGNASISVAAAEVSAGSSMTLQVGAFDDFEGCRVRLEAQTVLLINAGELEAPTSSIKTTQSLRTPSEFTRQISMVFYVGGRASLRSHLIVSEGAMLVVPPILSLTARARLQIWGRLRATQLFMREAAEIELFPTASTDESTGPNTFSFESVNVVDDARLILYNASSLIASLVTVGGPEGAPAGTITVNGRVYLETPSFEVHVTGVVDGRGRGYGASRGPGKSIADNGGGSHGGLGGQRNTDLGIALSEKSYGDFRRPFESGSGGHGAAEGGGGPGGAAVHIKAEKYVQLDGVINVGGRRGSALAKHGANSGGGAGGSVWLETLNLLGAGQILASGGDGAENKKTVGAGGGGRIAVQCSGNTSFSGSYAAYGGEVSGGGDVFWNRGLCL